MAGAPDAPSDVTDAGPAPAPLAPKRRIDPWLELVLLVALAFGIAYGIQRFVVKPFFIPSESMEETLHAGDRVLAARFWYRFTDPQRGDVVVFHPPLRPDDEELPPLPRVAPDVDRADSSVTFIKRIIGLPGDWIGGRAGRVWICSARPRSARLVARDPACRALLEPYVKGPQCPFQFIHVPPGRYFVMGDNRDNSEDSRYRGTVKRSWILGRAFARYWPPDRIGLLARDGGGGAVPPPEPCPSS